MDGLYFELHHPVPKEKVLLSEHPWEANSIGHVTIFLDGNLYRMYYSGYYGGIGYSWENEHYTCYAESKDGIHWTKPTLGLFEWEGSKDNNLVWVGGKTPAPFKDTNPKCPPDQKYKALVGNPAYSLVSPDGIHWHLLSDKPVFGNTFGYAFWNAQKNCYISHLRTRHMGARYHAYATSDDFVNWSKQQVIDTGEALVEHLYWNVRFPIFGHSIFI